MPMAPGSVKMEVSANQAKKSVAGDDSLRKMELEWPEVKDKAGVALPGDRAHSSASSGKVTETRVPLPTSLSMSSCP